MQTLSDRALNRATLARQHLLKRSDLSAVEMVSHLGGMQAQAPLSPYVGLWTRLASFAPEDLAGPLLERRLVRAVLQRATVHLVTAEDALYLRPLVDRLLEARFDGHFRAAIEGLDRTAFRAAARELTAEAAYQRPALGRALADRFPGHDAEMLSYAAVYMTPLAQTTPRGVWGASTAAAPLIGLETWLGGPMEPDPSPGRLVLRHLGAFGPATVADVQLWCGLTRLKEVAERLDLVRFRAADGRLLYDLPDAPRPPEDVPAPPRLLPEYDNLLLSHKDRSRVIPERRRVPLPPGHGASGGTFLLDGLWRGEWKFAADGAFELHPHVPLRPSDEEALTAEGLALARWAGREVAEARVLPPA
ncbi:winged helix DNA-binding domain-containing protein [Actinocorallia longicatena]|uniref:Winged helix DNA-binding domain-containing protein n=1 Tax=Actinocorallia longicatena TaxID=111803 RepID=A0ABP6Q5Y1_9ACTN